jgi:hypothetical protein
MEQMNASTMATQANEEIEEEEDDRLMSPAQRLDGALGTEDIKGDKKGSKKDKKLAKKVPKKVVPLKTTKKPTRKIDKLQIEETTKNETAMFVDTRLGN